MKNNRRIFLQKTFKTTAFATLAIHAGSHSILGANDRIRLGVIGSGDRGTDRFRTAMALGAEVVAVCDVNQITLARARSLIDDKADAYNEHERVLERKDIDAVIIATPDHWHRDIFLDAMNAGKDVYQEKPLSKTIEEGKSMVEAAQKANRIVQIGNHRRSGSHWREAFKAIRDGLIGDIKWIRTYDCRNFSGGDPWQVRGRDLDRYDPAKIDWKRFLGSAPDRPYSPERCSAWRWFWDYAGGLLTDIGAHNVDVGLWMADTLNVKSVVANGGTYHFDFWETPDIVHTTMDCGTFSLDFSVNFVNGFDNYGHSIFGTKGSIVQHGNDPFVKAFTQDNPNEPVTKWEMNDEGTAHMQNFLDCVKSRQTPNSPIGTAHKIITACHLSNIAYRQGSKIQWDAERERIIG